MWAIAIVALALGGNVSRNATPEGGQTFTVTPNGTSHYIIDGVNDPTLTLERGSTYTFNVSAGGHPFWIKTVQSTGTGNAYNDGVTNNGVQNGVLTFTVPQTAPSTLFYNCSIHSAMTGQINIQAPASVPGGPGRTSLQIVPNPAFGSVRFDLAIATAGQSVEVLDVRGRMVRRFRTPSASLAWDGTDESGGKVSPGVYLVRLRGDAGSPATKRLFWLGR
jgi:hypothetical protein